MESLTKLITKLTAHMMKGYIFSFSSSSLIPDSEPMVALSCCEVFMKLKEKKQGLPKLKMLLLSQ
jgi:hypothetical protein